MQGIRSTLRWVAIGLVGVFLTLCVLDSVFPPPIDRGRIVSTIVTDREGRPLRAFPVEDGRWRIAADLETIDPAFVDALIAVEDKRFFRHLGVDPLAIARALRSALLTGEITSGASTLTMQTARLLEPRPRTLSSKLIEALRAVQLEIRLSKEEILELYLTLAPYGGNLEGVHAASYAWFGRQPSNLTPDQIALLLALPQSPEARRPDRHPERAARTRNALLDRFVRLNLLDAYRALDAQQEDVPQQRAVFPSRAWHAGDELRQRTTTAGNVTSTLDWTLQAEAERLLTQAANAAGEDAQFSAMIIEVENRAVRASIGSAGRHKPGGWIDLTDRQRSPGSALKPFIYGLAFDDGTIAPGTVINDLPSRFASYRPENFDRTFRGEVTISDALQHSLNVPAVRVLDEVGANRFLSALTFAGGNPVMPDSQDVDAGLAVALGGLGMSVRDLGILYAGLADGGKALPLAWTPDEAERNLAADGFQIMSSESADEVLTILKGAPPPPGRIPTALSQDVQDIAFKTGTSYGFRDAWAAGTSGGYAVIVWTGRPDGTPRPGVTGRAAAAPLLFDLFDAVHRSRRQSGRTHFATSVNNVPATLSRFAPDDAAPSILFPPDQAEIWTDELERGFILSARGEGSLHWYADGEPVSLDAGGAPLWRPQGPGFYRLVVVDEAGRQSIARVRVLTDG